MASHSLTRDVPHPFLCSGRHAPLRIFRCPRMKWCVRGGADGLSERLSRPSCNLNCNRAAGCNSLCFSHLGERAKGFEPSTSSLGSWHSTTELRPRVKGEERSIEIFKIASAESV